MVIDAHIHLIKPFDSKGHPQIYAKGKPASAEEYGALMDASGVDAAFFISWSPEDIPSDLMVKGIPPETVRETMNREYALDVMRRYPDRLYWFPCHLGPEVPDSLQGARENLELGACGLKLVCSFWGELPDDPRLLPMYELAREFRANIILDTSYWYLGKDDPRPPEELPPGHRDVARRIRDFADYAAHLDAVIARYPDVNFQLAHAGARTLTRDHAREVGALIARYPNVFADVGALPIGEPAFEDLVRAAGADRIMFGTDWPHFAQGPDMLRLIGCVLDAPFLAPSEQEAILGGNARRFVRGRVPGLDLKRCT